MFVAVVNAQHDPHNPWSLIEPATPKLTQLKEDGTFDKLGAFTERKEELSIFEEVNNGTFKVSICFLN